MNEKIYKEYNLKIVNASGVAIPAVQSRADSDSVVVLCHGITTDKDEYLGFFKILARKLSVEKIDSVRFDFRGHGESKCSIADFSVSSQVSDLSAVLDHIQGQYENVYLLGCSFGAPPCLMLHNVGRHKIKGIFLIAPVLDYKRTFFEPETSWGIGTFGKAKIENVFKGTDLKLSDRVSLSKKHFVEMSLINIEEKSNLEVSVDIIHGERDNMVPNHISREWSRKYRTVNYYEIYNMEHGFTNLGDSTGESEETKNNLNKMVEIISGRIYE